MQRALRYLWLYLCAPSAYICSKQNVLPNTLSGGYMQDNNSNTNDPHNNPRTPIAKQKYIPPTVEHLSASNAAGKNLAPPEYFWSARTYGPS